MMVPMAPSLRAPTAFSLIQRMRSSLVHAMSRKEFMRAEKEQVDRFLPLLALH